MDVDESVVEVDVVPLEGAKLTPTGTGGGAIRRNSASNGVDWSMRVMAASGEGGLTRWRRAEGSVANVAGLRSIQPHRIAWCRARRRMACTGRTVAGARCF
ncbi:hypothetical protein BH20ACT3_BH20ACT3_16040 [soil metagenome]